MFLMNPKSDALASGHGKSSGKVQAQDWKQVMIRALEPYRSPVVRFDPRTFMKLLEPPEKGEVASFRGLDTHRSGAVSSAERMQRGDLCVGCLHDVHSGRLDRWICCHVVHNGAKVCLQNAYATSACPTGILL